MGRKKNLKDVDENDIELIESKMGYNINDRTIKDYANSGKFLNYKIELKCKNKKQKELVKTIEENKITFVEGVFGVGKTYVINSIALKMLKEIGNEIDKIILIMPTLEVGQMHLGMLPGDLSQKLEFHSMNELDSFKKILKNSGNMGSSILINELMKNGLIEIRPISYLRGASLNNAFICVSEAEEFTKEELFMILTRYESGKMVISGDPLQSSRNNVKNGDSGLLHAMSNLKGIDGVGIVKFNDEDIVRNDILLDIYKKWKTD